MISSLKTRMTLVVSLLVSGLLSLMALAAFSYFERQFKEIISGQQFTLVSALAGEIDGKIRMIQEEITAVAGTATPELLGDPAGLRRFLRNRPDTLGVFDSGVYIFSPDCRILASTGSEQWKCEGGDCPFTFIVRKSAQTRGALIAGPYFLDRDENSPRRFLVAFTAPVFDRRGKVAAVMVGGIDLLKDNFLGKISSVKLGQGGYLYLYSDDRKLIIHPDRGRVLRQDMPKPGVNPLFDLSLAGFEGTGETVTSKGLVALSSFKRLKTTNWILAANFPRAEVYAPIRRARGYLFAALAIGVFCSVLVVRFVMKRLTAPLMQFSDHVREMTDRQAPPAPIAVRGSASSEIVTLAAAFNGMLSEMEERKKGEQDQLRFLETLLDTLPIPVYFKDTEGMYIGCNRRFAESIGLSRGDLTGKTIYDIAPRELADEYSGADAELFRRQGVQVYEGRMKCGDGTLREGVFYKATFLNADGALGGLIGAFLDITERKRAEAALMEQTEFTENLIRNSAVPTFVLDSRHRVLIWNRACEELTGVKGKEVIGTGEAWKAFYDHERPVLADFILDGNLKDIPANYEIQGRSLLIPEGLKSERWFTDLNGRQRYIIFNAAPIRNGKGELIAVIQTLEDITDRRLAEERLLGSEMRMRAILDTAVDGIITISEEGTIKSVNRSGERMFGYGAGELAGLNVAVLMPSPFREEHDGYIARYLRTGEKRVVESRREVIALRKDGTLFPAELAVSEVRLGEKRLFSGMITDISERKEREEEMRRTLSLLGATLESTADGILVVDLKGKIVSCNQKLVELWRLPAAFLSDHDDKRALVSAQEQLSDPEGFLAKVRELYAHPEAESRDVLEFKDGRIFERYSKPQRIGDSIVGRVWSFSDLTEQRKLEAQLRQSQKMEALGTLAGGVAHDFNNILTAIIGFSNLLQMNMEESDPRRQHLNQILAAAERATGLTQSLLAYSRNKPLNPGRVNLNAIVRKVGKFLSRLIGEDIELTITIADEALTIMADDGQIEQVLMNLAANARDAMAGEGSLIIRTGPIELDQEFVSSHGYGITGRYALVSVSDTGSGMDRQTTERIFEPFFTTKQMGRGTGLGLSIVYGIVKQHNGYINVYSEIEKGTTFNIYFPLTEAAGEEKPAAEIRRPDGGSETILHVEDSEEIRALMREVLTGAGYTVIEAVDGQEGVEKFREHWEEVQLLILDVIMPRKNGKELYDEIRAMKSDVRCIFTSGYTADIISRKGIMEEGYNFVTKPLSPNALLAKVREVLDGEVP